MDSIIVFIIGFNIVGSLFNLAISDTVGARLGWTSAMLGWFVAFINI